MTIAYLSVPMIFDKDAFGPFSRKGDIFGWGKNISDFKLLTLELLKLHHQSSKLKFLKYAAQVTIANLCTKFMSKNQCNIRYGGVKYLINRYFFSKYKNPIYFLLSQQLIRKADLFHQFLEQKIVRKLFTIIVKIAYLVLH